MTHLLFSFFHFSTFAKFAKCSPKLVSKLKRSVQLKKYSKSVSKSKRNIQVYHIHPQPPHPISKGASCECACARERYYTPPPHPQHPPTIQSNISPRVANDAVGKNNGLCRLICPRCLGQKPCSKGEPQGVIEEALVWGSSLWKHVSKRDLSVGVCL